MTFNGPNCTLTYDIVNVTAQLESLPKLTDNLRKHTSRMRTARLLTVSHVRGYRRLSTHPPGVPCLGWVGTHPPWAYPPTDTYSSPLWHTPKGPGKRDFRPPRNDIGPEIPLPMDRMTDTCENITFPQLRWRAVTRRCWDLHKTRAPPSELVVSTAVVHKGSCRLD